MTPLRATIEADLATTLEGDFASIDAQGVGRVTLVAPNGDVYTGLKGQVLYDQRRVDPDTGQVIVVHEPVIVLRRASLTRIPLASERWYVRFPSSPVDGSPLLRGLLSDTRAPEGGETLGIIRLYPTEVSQIPPEDP